MYYIPNRSSPKKRQINSRVIHPLTMDSAHPGAAGSRGTKGPKARWNYDGAFRKTAVAMRFYADVHSHASLPRNVEHSGARAPARVIRCRNARAHLQQHTCGEPCRGFRGSVSTSPGPAPHERVSGYARIIFPHRYFRVSRLEGSSVKARCARGKCSCCTMHVCIYIFGVILKLQVRNVR